MNCNIKVVQMCSYYTGSKLYMEMFSKLDNMGIKQIIFVPILDIELKNININYNMKNSRYIYAKNFTNLDRLIYFTKIKKIFKDSIDKIDFKNVNLIHAHSLFINGGVARMLKKTKDINYIVEIQNTDINIFFKYIIYLRDIGFKILKDASTLVFYSSSYRDFLINTIVPCKLREELISKSIVIPSGINDFWISNIYKKRVAPEGNRINIIYMGIIDTNKNIETTIEACKMLNNEGYKVNYKIIGKIVNKKYDSIIRQNSFIEYINHSPKEKLLAYLRGSDIFIMPSKHETFGLVYAEAMSQGLPVIYTRGQGFDGQFEEGVVGYSVQYNSVEEIVEKIKKVLNNYKVISNNCIGNVDRFNWKNIAHTYEGIYNSMLEIENKGQNE